MVIVWIFWKKIFYAKKEEKNCSSKCHWIDCTANISTCADRVNENHKENNWFWWHAVIAAIFTAELVCRRRNRTYQLLEITSHASDSTQSDDMWAHECLACNAHRLHRFHWSENATQSNFIGQQQRVSISISSSQVISLNACLSPNLPCWAFNKTDFVSDAIEWKKKKMEKKPKTHTQNE